MSGVLAGTVPSAGLINGVQVQTSFATRSPPMALTFPSSSVHPRLCDTMGAAT